MYTTVLDIFEKSVEKFSEKVLIKDVEGQQTYRNVQNNAKKIGCSLINATNKKRNIPIVIFIDKGCDCLAAMLGVLYSGNIYVPMDIKTPIDRLQSIMDTLESNVIIATKKSKETLDKMGYNDSVLIYEELVLEAENVDDKMLDEILAETRQAKVDTDLIYILFTSGSTGVPKGVAITHRSVLDYIMAFIKEVPINADDIVGNQVPFYVDMSLKDIYMSMAVGASICVIPQKFFMTPKKVLKYLDENQVTMLMWVPTAYSIMAQFDVLSKVKPTSLKKFLFSGEGMPLSVFNYWKNQYPTASWIQQYGPTEITGACTSYTVNREFGEGEIIPIGKPFENTGILLLNEMNQEVTKDMVDIQGEICVYGTCLAAGYYNNPQKTEEVFVQNPLVKAYPSKMYRTGDLAKWDGEGNLVFISRKDYQIKHGGRRIELGEIETAVDSIEAVKLCCCVHDEKQDVIVLFYVGNIEEKELREMVRNKIPQYMVPGKYIKRDDLPRLSNGKLDRKRLSTYVKEGGEE